MPRKGENIRKRKDGRWEGRYKKGVKENGSTDYCSVYGKTYKEVKEKLLDAKKCEENITFVSDSEKRFGEVLDLWAISNKLRIKGSTEQRYDYLIKNHIAPELGKVRLSQLTSASINAFLLNKLSNGRIDRKGGLSPSYVRSIMIIISSALNFAVAEQMCLPLKTPICKPSPPKKELNILSPEDQIMIEKYASADLSPIKTGILITLYTGLRIGEICALSWDDVDLTEKILHVRHTVARVKNNKTSDSKTILIIDEPKTKASKRDIPIPSILFSILKEHKKKFDSKYIASGTNTFASPRTYEYRYHQVLNSCGVNPINYHALRHTFATRCIEAGVDVKTLSEILGHTNVSVTLNTYVHSSLNQKRTQLEKLVSLTAARL